MTNLTIERLEEFISLIIWMTGGVMFTNEQADLFGEGIDYLNAEVERQSAKDIDVPTNADRIRSMRLIDEIAYQAKIAKIPVEERTFVRAWEKQEAKNDNQE